MQEGKEGRGVVNNCFMLLFLFFLKVNVPKIKETGLA